MNFILSPGVCITQVLTIPRLYFSILYVELQLFNTSNDLIRVLWNYTVVDASLLENLHKIYIVYLKINNLNSFNKTIFTKPGV